MGYLRTYLSVLPEYIRFSIPPSHPCHLILSTLRDTCSEPLPNMLLSRPTYSDSAPIANSKRSKFTTSHFLFRLRRAATHPKKYPTSTTMNAVDTAPQPYDAANGKDSQRNNNLVVPPAPEPAPEPPPPYEPQASPQPVNANLVSKIVRLFVIVSSTDSVCYVAGPECRFGKAS